MSQRPLRGRRVRYRMVLQLSVQSVPITTNVVSSNPAQAMYTRYIMGPSWSWSYGSWIYNYLCNQCLSPLMLWVRISIRAMCTTLCDKVCQWFATGRLFSPGTPVSSTNKTDRHDINEILLKVALNTIKVNLKHYTVILVIYEFRFK